MDGYQCLNSGTNSGPCQSLVVSLLLSLARTHMKLKKWYWVIIRVLALSRIHLTSLPTSKKDIKEEAIFNLLSWCGCQHHRLKLHLLRKRELSVSIAVISELAGMVERPFACPDKVICITLLCIFFSPLLFLSLSTL